MLNASSPLLFNGGRNRLNGKRNREKDRGKDIGGDGGRDKERKRAYIE
jgi:hypothetical protein